MLRRAMSTLKINIHPTIPSTTTIPGQTPTTTRLLTDLLQRNHDTHHIFFNKSGFHNHIAHHLLALYAVGAQEPSFQRAYKSNVGYQRPLSLPAYTPRKVEKSGLLECLGDGERYADYLTFFSGEVEQLGWRETIVEYVFADNELGRNMSLRLLGGLLHPLIHLGYAVEFAQPALVAEALAQTAATGLDKEWVEFFEKSEKKSEGETLVKLLSACRADEQLRNAVRWEDPQKNISLMQRASSTMTNIASRFVVPNTDETTIAAKTAEVISAAAYVLAASQRPDKEIRLDFFLLHAFNASLFLSVFVGQDWIPAPWKRRVVERHGRILLNYYVSRGAPELHVDEIKKYVPREVASNNPWLHVIDRAIGFDDDGHLVKLVRACVNGEYATRGHEGEDGYIVSGEDWYKIATMAVDAAESGGTAVWIRSTGFDEAWAEGGFGGRRRYDGRFVRGESKI